jgi:hypothetical protein
MGSAFRSTVLTTRTEEFAGDVGGDEQHRGDEVGEMAAHSSCPRPGVRADQRRVVGRDEKALPACGPPIAGHR